MLSVENLSFSFRQLKLFANLSFSIQEKELLVIKGPNGCGKSTLLSLLIGARNPDSGTISYKDKKFPGDYLGAEANHLFQMRSAEENLKIWCELLQIKKSRAEIFSELKEWDLAHPFFSTQLPVARFSTGMKRRLTLARIGLCEKKLWLLDEPLFGLDVEAVDILKVKLKKHLENNGAAIIVSHDDRLYQDLPFKIINLMNFKGGDQ